MFLYKALDMLINPLSPSEVEFLGQEVGWECNISHWYVHNIVRFGRPHMKISTWGSHPGIALVWSSLTAKFLWYLLPQRFKTRCNR